MSAGIIDRLAGAVARAPCEAVLASGGIDSTAVVAAHARLGLRPLLVSVQLLESPGDDLAHVQAVAARLEVPLAVRFVTRGEALEAVREAVRILRVFNPMEVVNCAAIYAALAEARARGVRRACTGDGGDELCIGYSYMLRMPLGELREYVRRLPERWRFCSTELGRALGVEVRAPFLEIADFLLSLPVEEQVRCGAGKCLLRAELERVVGELAWRRKSPVEAGTGFSALYGILAEMGRGVAADIPVEGAARYLYHVYRSLGYSYPRGVRSPCPVCGHELSGGYCPMCGFFDSSRGRGRP